MGRDNGSKRKQRQKKGGGISCVMWCWAALACVLGASLLTVGAVYTVCYATVAVRTIKGPIGTTCNRLQTLFPQAFDAHLWDSWGFWRKSAWSDAEIAEIKLMREDMFKESKGTAPKSAVELDIESFPDQVLGWNITSHPTRASFIKFMAPWCGHCKKFAPTWNMLSESLKKDKDNILIANFDCTAGENQPVCKTFEVTGYPTLRYYVPDRDSMPGTGTMGVKYDGQTDLTALLLFVKEVLLPKCSDTREDLCTRHEVETLNKYRQMSTTERERLIKKMQAEEEAILAQFEKDADELKTKLTEAMAKYDVLKAAPATQVEGLELLQRMVTAEEAS